MAAQRNLVEPRGARAERHQHRAAAFEIALDRRDARARENANVGHDERGVIRERALADRVGTGSLDGEARVRERADGGGEVGDVIAARVGTDDERARFAVLDDGIELVVLGQGVRGLQRDGGAVGAGAEVEVGEEGR